MGYLGQHCTTLRPYDGLDVIESRACNNSACSVDVTKSLPYNIPTPNAMFLPNPEFCILHFEFCILNFALK